MNAMGAKDMIEDSVLTPKCAYKYTGLDNEGHRINPFSYIARQENKDCNASVVRFVNNIDMEKIEGIIHSIPETHDEQYGGGRGFQMNRNM